MFIYKYSHFDIHVGRGGSMRYNVTLYYKTGFTTLNIPWGPYMLSPEYGLFSGKYFDALDLVQGGILGAVAIHATYHDVLYADYLVLRYVDDEDPDDIKEERWYYSIFGPPTMASNDVAILPIALDAITTFGGIDNLVLTGTTKRISILEWQEYQRRGLSMNVPELYFPTGDPLLMPSEPLVAEYVGTVDPKNPTKSGTSAVGTGGNFIESTIDLSVLGQATYTDAQSYIDAGGQNHLTIPVLPPSSGTLYKSIRNSVVQTFRQTGLYRADNATVKQGLANARALGVEGCVISQVAIPSYVADYAEDASGRITAVSNGSGHDSFLTTFTGIGTPTTGTAPLARLTYGDYCRAGIITTAGESYSARVEELYYMTTNYAARVVFFVDARPDGCVYYKLLTKGITDSHEDNTGNQGIPGSLWGMVGAIKGSHWAQIPLIFYEKSGSVLDKINYQATQDMAQTAYDSSIARLNQGRVNDRKNYDLGVQGVALQRDRAEIGRIRSDSNIIGGIIGGLASGVTGAAGGMLAGGAAGGVIGGVIGVGAGVYNAVTQKLDSDANFALGQADRQLQLQQLAQSYHNSRINTNITLGELSQQYQAQRALDAANFAFSQSAVTPTVFFDYDSDYARDYLGEACIIYQTHYSQADEQRIYKLLNAYGMYYNTQIDDTLIDKTLTNFFCYIQSDDIEAVGTRGSNDGVPGVPGVAPVPFDRFHPQYDEVGTVSDEGLPNWAIDAIRLQLSGGVRIWHTVTDGQVGDLDYYSENYKRFPG